MTLLQRFKTPFADDPADQTPPPRYRQVGDMLQERREDLGLDLDEIAAMLKIKPAYLVAIEQGRSEELPGPTYALGFVRAYADFLGLDAERTLAQYKSQTAGISERQDLTLPMPLGERSLPGGTLVLVALIVAVCGYGTWYYLSTGDRDRPERVAAVPPALQAAAAQVIPPSASVSPSANASPSVGASSTASAPPGPDRIAAPPLPPLAPPPATGNAAAGASVGRPSPVPATPMPAAPAAVQAGAPATASAPQQQAATPTQQAAAPQPAAPAAVDPTASRVAIRAISDCWIQIRAPNQSIVISRVLKAGEIYKVPPRTGLSLRTGNAGALDITVDGKAVPSIGGIGALRRDVVLDPAALAAGTAVRG